MDKYPKYISESQQEEFENFLLGNMNLVEAKTFKEKLKNDPRLNTYFEEFKTMSLIIEEETLRNKLDDFHNAIPENTLDKKSNFNFYRIAASVVILISLSVWLMGQQMTRQMKPAVPEGLILVQKVVIKSGRSGI